jgi:exonuclease III
MKIATFNVNGINGRLPVLLRWLAEAKPDVVCLQELKAPDEKFPEPAIREAGYRAVWHGQKSWNGVSVDREVRGWEKASDHAPTWIELGPCAEAAAYAFNPGTLCRSSEPNR